MKQSFCFEKLKTPLTKKIKEQGNGPAGKVAATGSGAGSGAESDAPGNEVRAEIIRGSEVEVEITNDKPTEAERKALEDFLVALQ